MNRVLVDTDVIMDFLLDREPFASQSEKIINLCFNKNIKGYTTPVIISNLYYILRKISTREKVTEKIRNLMSFFDVAPIDKKVILTALNSEFSDFEDALQNYAALSSGNIDFIITRNIKDYKKSSIGVLTPVEFPKTIYNK